MNLHLENLKKLCRVCGQRLNKYYQARHAVNGYLKTENKDKLKETYGIDITFDNNEVHPQKMCKSCLVALGKPSNREVNNWQPHQDGVEKDEETDKMELKCRTCRQIASTSKGGRRKKPSNIAKKRREEQRKLECWKERLDSACTTILESNITSEPPTKKMQQVASTIIKRMITEKDVPIQLATGGPVSKKEI